MAVIAPINLHFEDSGDWYSLPEWAEYFISIGKDLARVDRSKSRIVTGIVVPTRAFGAAFVSLGMAISDAAACDRSSKAAHFMNLLDLPPNTPVIYRRKPEQTLKGILVESKEISGKQYVRVQVHSKNGGGLTYNIDESLALQVQPASHSGKLPRNQSGAGTRFASQFVDALLGEADPVQLGVRSKVCCAIVGRRNILEHEIRKTPLALHANGYHCAEGTLQDVLRVDQFVTKQQSYRSALVPVGSSSPSNDVTSKIEMGVVFDGAVGFLKWGAMWPDQHQIIILDRTELYFDDAISAINSRFSQNRTDAESPLPGIDAPPGGEVLAFREAIP